MAVGDNEELLEALKSGDFARVLGTPEAGSVDFKSEPYSMNTPKGPAEYSKDVAAFANAEGGLIVLGYKTKKNASELEEVAEEHRPVPKSMVDVGRLRSSLDRIVYPKVRGVRAEWFPPGTDQAHGVLVIEVPRQSAEDKPFFVKKFISDSGHEAEGITIPVRSGAVTDYTSVETLHARLTKADALIAGLTIGLGPAQADAVVQRAAGSARNSAEGRLAPGLGMEGQGSLETWEQRIARETPRAEFRIQEIRNEIGWTDWPAYFLQALPPAGSALLQDLHSDIRSALLHPQVIRSLGFHPASGVAPEVRDSGLVYVQGTRSITWLDRDGFFTAGAVAGPDFLGWAVNQGRESGPGPFNINSIALVEFTLEFFRLLYREIMPRARVGKWSVRVCARGFLSINGGVRLGAGSARDLMYMRVKPATGDDQTDVLEPSGDPWRDAYLALVPVYALFGLSPAEIPFVEGESKATRRISESGLREA